MLEEVVIENNRHYMEFEGLDVVLFAGRDGARLLDQYNRTRVAPNEIALFLEVNDSTNYFGSVVRVLCGDEIKDMPGLPYDEIARFARSKNVEVSATSMKKFIDEGIDATKNGLMRFLMKCVSAVVKASGFVFDGIAGLFEKTIPEKIDYFRINEESWKGDSLLFVPDAVVKLLRGATAKDGDKIIRKITKPLFGIIESLCDTADECVRLIGDFFPARVYRKVKKVIGQVQDRLLAFRDYVAENSAVFFEILLSSLRVFNAMLCGLVNSIVDFVKGIFQIIGIVFRIIAEGLDIYNNILFYTAYISEIIENFIGALIAIDYPALFREMLQVPIRLYKSFREFLSKGFAVDIDLVTAAYYCGYIIGLIIQTVIEILLTGGTVTLAKIAEYLKAPFVALSNVLKAAMGAAKTVFRRVVEFISYLVGKLRKPKQLIDDFLNFVDELLNGAKKEAGITGSAEQDLLANWDRAARRSRRLGQKLFAADLKKIEEHLKKMGYEFGIIPEKGAHTIEGFFGPDGKALVFGENKQAAFVYTAGKARLILREKATVYEVFHELMHARQAKSMGLKKYYSLGGYGKTGELMKEQYVFDKIAQNMKLFTKKELEDALDYLNDDIYARWGRDPVTYKFDIEKVPSVRKEISIDAILKIK